MSNITTYALDKLTVRDVTNMGKQGILTHLTPDSRIAVHADSEQLARIFDREEERNLERNIG